MERTEYHILKETFGIPLHRGGSTGTTMKSVATEDICIAWIRSWTPDSAPEVYTDLAEAIAAFKAAPIGTRLYSKHGLQFLQCEVAVFECVISEYDEDYEEWVPARKATEAEEQSVGLVWADIPGYYGFRAMPWTAEKPTEEDENVL